MNNNKEQSGICYIFGALETVVKIETTKNDIVIAADGGYQVAKSNGISPDIVLGDFDSLGFVPTTENTEVFPVKKNDTDVMLAVKKGFEKGFNLFKIFGAVGGRTDHTVANIQTLCYIAKQGGRGFLINGDETLTVIKDGEFLLNEDKSKSESKTVSVFAVCGEAFGVSLEGLEYVVQNHTLSPQFPLGISNISTGENAKITVKDGYLLIVLSPVEQKK